MASTIILAGLSLAGGATLARTALRAVVPAAKRVDDTVKHFQRLSFENYKYYRGGFEPKMTKREAALILGIGQSSNGAKVKEFHRRIMLINHPDKGGSPYLAAKINQAKDLLIQGNRK